MKPALRVHTFVTGLFVVLLASVGLDAAAQTVARVNGTPISNEQLDRAYEAVLRERKLHVSRMQNPKQARELKRLALDRLITEELFWQQAQKDGLVLGDAEVEKSFQESAARFPPGEAFAMQLMRQGMDEAAFRSSIRRLLSADRYAQRVVEQRVAITPADIEAFYRVNAHLYARPETLRVRTIAIALSSSATAEQRRTASLHAATLRQQLLQGASFDQLARQNSDDPTRQWGGALDPAALTDLPGWMQKPVALLKPGELSPVIETAAGYHLLKLDERVPASSVPLAEVREGIYQQLLSSRGREAIDKAAAELRASAKVEMFVPL